MRPIEGFITDLKQSFPNSADQVQEVLRMYRDYNKFNLFGLAPSMCSNLKDVPYEITEQALSLYKKKADRDHRAPHPNYFLTICHRMEEEKRPPIQLGQDKDEPPLIMGKSI